MTAVRPDRLVHDYVHHRLGHLLRRTERGDGGTGYENADSTYLEQGPGGALPNGSGCYQIQGGYIPGVELRELIHQPWAGFVGMEGEPCDLTANVISAPTCTGATNSTERESAARSRCSARRRSGSASAPCGATTCRRTRACSTPGSVDLRPQVVLAGNGWLCIDPNSSGGIGRFDGPGQIKNMGAAGEITLSSAEVESGT